MIFLYKYTSLISEHEILETSKELKPYAKHLKNVAILNNYTFDESSINLPFDEIGIKQISSLKENLVNKNLKYIINIGIGGSNLGTKAVYDALYGYTDLLEPDRFPKIIFADTTDSSFLFKLGIFIQKYIKNSNEILLNVISKSGNTLETIVNSQIIFEQLLKSDKWAKERLVITTDKNSVLWEWATANNVKCLEIPKKVGGRYSMFSAVGLFPLLCANIDVISLIEGAMETRCSGIEDKVFENPVMLSAIILFKNWQAGKYINDNFFFAPELESLGKWYRQLMAESLGKDGKGITPTTSIGSTDLHSAGQLYLGGPKDKFFTLISIKSVKHSPRVPVDSPLTPLLKEMQDKTLQEIMRNILEGVKKTYAENELPFCEIVLENVSEKTIGSYMQFKMIETMYLGKLLNVNAFDQPDVENYKKNTKQGFKKL